MIPLVIVQARMGSTRFPGKVLEEIGGKSMVRRVYDAGCDAVGQSSVVIAIPATTANDILAEHCRAFGAHVFEWVGDENDVLGRFLACANAYRWHPETIIVRLTADDPFKSSDAIRDVLAGIRRPVELGGEAFRLGALRVADVWEPGYHSHREHLTLLRHGEPPPPPAGYQWTVDTPADLDAVRRQLGQ